MKYLKYFELVSRTGNELDYDVGDIVIWIPVIENKYYEVLKIYTIPEDKFLKNKNPFMRVDVKDIETGEIFKGFRSDQFKLEAEYFADKYNL